MSHYECPACEGDDIITIHDTLHACDASDCGVLYNPRADDPDPTYPVRGAIGFCPRCESNARGHRDDVLGELFQCPSCDYEWFDDRIDGVILAKRFALYGWPTPY